MDEQSTQTDSELEKDTAGHEVADTTATDTEEQETDSKDKQEQETPQLEKEEKPPQAKSKAEIVRDQQIDAWTAKIASGEKSLDDLPANLQWLKPHVEAKLGVKAPDIKELVTATIAQEREEQKFKALQDDFAGLKKETRDQVTEKYRFFRSRGLSKLDSLETALEALNIDLSMEKVESKRQAMRLRTPGQYKAAKGTDLAEIHDEAGYGEVAKNIPEAQRLEYLRKLRQRR